MLGETSFISITIVDASEYLGVVARKMCFLKASLQNLLKRGSVTNGSGGKRKRGVEEMEEERKEGEGWTEGSLKAQCARENRSVPSPRQPTAQAH